MLAVAGTLAVLLLSPVIALADSLVTVDCGDGAPMSTTAGLTSLTSLQASIQGARGSSGSCGVPGRPDADQPGNKPAPASQPAISVTGSKAMAAMDQSGGPGRSGSGAGMSAAVMALASSQP